ncbi:MAG TPA: histidine phosphatase family protein, partial [Actinomycetes bacterium]|nr:histidine phosphatase family protein [Actinomycetes bacterium]
MASTLVFLVRHAKAADRYDWTGGDRDRPLIDKGRRQADRLAAALRR